MRKTMFRTSALILLGSAMLLTGGALARADDYDGKWTMNANGWTFILKLEQNGDRITGFMTGVNNKSKTAVEGRINGNEITFDRVFDDGGRQSYRGHLFYDDPTGRANKTAMAGTFKSGDDHAGWYATR
jgi:hypothetical protein